MDKKFLLVANWKANDVDTQNWINQLLAFSLELLENDKLEIAIAAPYTHISAVSEFLKANSYKLPAALASQDVSQFPEGAYTGEITANMLADIGVKYCLVGHSERRKYFAENNAIVAKKFDQAINSGIIPIICAQSIQEIPEEIRNYPAEKLVVMYEPFEAISTNGQYHPESPEDVQNTLVEWQKKLPAGIKFLYGGSVNKDNCSSFMIHGSLLSGFVVGHASLDPEEFFAIIKQCLQSPSA